MQAHYNVELTDTAEKSYERLYDEAAETGDGSKQKKALLASIELALDKTIPANPLNSELALAGRLSNIFKLDLGAICIFYMVVAECNCVYVLHIGSPQNCVDRSWLHDAVLSGKMGNLLQRLGIDKPSLLDETSLIWPH